MATSKNSFLMIWVRYFGSTKVSESPEYFVYCELFRNELLGQKIRPNRKRGVFRGALIYKAAFPLEGRFSLFRCNLHLFKAHKQTASFGIVAAQASASVDLDMYLGQFGEDHPSEFLCRALIHTVRDLHLSFG